MVTRPQKIILYGALGVLLLAAVVVALLAAPVASAAPMLQDATPVPNAEDCTGCHEGLRGYWEGSAHGNALADPVFQEAWQKQGSPQECLACHTTGFDSATGEYDEEGVSCLACHSPVPANHPDSYMPTDVSARLCGECHVDTFADWEISEHGEQGMTCNQCHNPHTADVRAGHTQELCQTCHNTEDHYYSFTGHAREGLLCTDCHLRVASAPEDMGMGHGQRHHTFEVDLQTCNSCHLGDMHAAVDDTTAPASIEPQTDVSCYPAEMIQASTGPAATAEPEPVSETPHGPSPLVYILPAAFGLAFGAVLAPWVERVARRRKEEK